MDSDPPPRSSATALASTSSSPSDEINGETSEEPYSPGTLLHTSAPVLGALIALITLVLPIASVITDRTSPPARTSTTSSLDGFAQPAGITSARPGEPAGGDSRRQLQ